MATTLGEYEKRYEESIKTPNLFWTKEAAHVTWAKKWDKVTDGDRAWFVGGKLNVAQNCLDRHIEAGFGESVAIIAVDEDGKKTEITYGELHKQVCKLANYLVGIGIITGDRVVICMPMIVEQVVAMLACARIGAIHSVVFAGFSPAAVKMRLEDLQAKLIITSDFTKRRGKQINILEIIESANTELKIKTLKFLRLTNEWSEPVSAQLDKHVAVEMDSEDPLFVLYTSGTTGKPKGVVHTTGGYLTYVVSTCKNVFELNPGDIFWCTADMGWITGHSYVVYGPLSVGATAVIVEGAPDFPDSNRWWRLIDELSVNIFYTSPTAIRLLMKYDSNELLKFKFDSLKLIGSVGEPLNPSVWMWLNEQIGRKRIPVVDTWWQTETGGNALVTLPGIPQKPGKAGLPFYGIDADVVEGLLVINNSWPAVMRTYWNDHPRYLKNWSEQGHYKTGDLATKDEDGYFQIIGRADDVLNIAGHRVGSAEIENILVAHPAVAESAVIGVADEIKGEVARAYVTLKIGYDASDSLTQELIKSVRDGIGKHVIIEAVEYGTKLPKTRSGKIMRRLLRSKALGLDIGDTSTLEN